MFTVQPTSSLAAPFLESSQHKLKPRWFTALKTALTATMLSCSAVPCDAAALIAIASPMTPLPVLLGQQFDASTESLRARVPLVCSQLASVLPEVQTVSQNILVFGASKACLLLHLPLAVLRLSEACLSASNSKHGHLTFHELLDDQNEKADHPAHTVIHEHTSGCKVDHLPEGKTTRCGLILLTGASTKSEVVQHTLHLDLESGCWTTLRTTTKANTYCATIHNHT